MPIVKTKSAAGISWTKHHHFGHSASNCDPDGVRFTKLYRYMDVDFVKEHPYIYLSVDGEDMIFQITALFVTDIGFDYIEPDPTGDDLTSFFETIARKTGLTLMA